MSTLCRFRRLMACVALLLFVLAGAATAQQAGVYIRIDDQPPYTSTFNRACQIDIAPGIHTALVLVANTFDFSAIRFTAVVPPGAIFVGDQFAPGTVQIGVGNSQTGIEVGMLGCSSGFRIPVLSILFFVPSALNDVTWVVGPAAGKPTIELSDCTGFPMKGAGQYSIYCEESFMLGPYKPNPPDGAVDVPINPLLSFTGGANLMYLGLDPQFDDNDVACDISAYGPDPCVFPFDPGTLLPNTTYYWLAMNVCTGCEHGEFGSSDVWSFTTGDAPLATQQTTWGHIKALYRD